MTHNQPIPPQITTGGDENPTGSAPTQQGERQPIDWQRVREDAGAVLRDKLFYERGDSFRPVFTTTKTSSAGPLPLSETLPYDLADAALAVIRKALEGQKS